MRYSEDVIEEVRSRSDIVDVISGYVQLKRSGSSYVGLCPFHNEKTPSFSVSRDKQLYYCFGCGAGGNVFTFLMQYENDTFQEAVKELADRAGMQLPEQEETEEMKRARDRRSVLLEINKEAAYYFYMKLHSPAGEQAMRYLKGRGLGDETMKRFGLGYADKYSRDLYRYFKKKGYGDEILQASGLFLMNEQRGATDKFWNRVMFPIMDVNSHVIGFGGRVMGDGKPKYLNSPETEIFDKSRNLYGLNIARRSRQKNLLICEGYMDVISVHQAGFDNAVASLGTSLTSGHCSLLKRYSDHVLTMYDSDEAGVRATLRAIPMLREAGLDTRVIHLEPYKDPDEFIKGEGREAFAQRIQDAENGLMFQIRMRERDFDLSDPGGRSDFLHAACEYLLTIEDEIERQSYLEEVARKYHIDREMLQKQVAAMALQNVGRRAVPEPRSTSADRSRPESGLNKIQRMLTAWMAEDKSVMDLAMRYLKEEDFTDELVRGVLHFLLEQARSGHEIRPADIISRYEDGEQQKQAASIFSTVIPDQGEDVRKKALNDMILQIKTESFERQLANAEGIEDIQRMMNARKELDELRRSGIRELG